MEKIKLADISHQQEEPEQYPADQVGPGKKVTLYFELALPEGEVIDSNFSDQPVDFIVGDGNLLPGFEEILFGLGAGDEHTELLAADRAFGQHNPENIRKFANSHFPGDLVLERGLMINFAGGSGNHQAGVVTDFDADTVEVDFNHPLAGRDIRFRVKILAVTKVSDQDNVKTT